MNEAECWRQSLYKRITELRNQRVLICTLDAHLKSLEVEIDSGHREAVFAMVRLIDVEIDRLQSDLILDDILSGKIEFDGKSLSKKLF